MKKFTKFMVSAAAMAAVAASMSMAAMATEPTATYDPVTGKVTLIDFASSGDQQTLLVLDGDVEGVTETTTVTSANASDVIAQIDQAGSISEFYLPSGITSHTYYIRVGGTYGTIQKYTLTIGGRETVVMYVGDANSDGKIMTSDVTAIKRKLNGKTTGIGKVGQEVGTAFEKVDSGNFYIGDANSDGKIMTSDVTAVKRKLNGKTTGIGKVGQEVGTTVEVYKD
jgi:hypothetical protein